MFLIFDVALLKELVFFDQELEKETFFHAYAQKNKQRTLQLSIQTKFQSQNIFCRLLILSKLKKFCCVFVVNFG